MLGAEEVKVQMDGKTKNSSNTVDGSEIPVPTTWDGHKTLTKIMGFQLPTSTGESRISEPSTV